MTSNEQVSSAAAGEQTVSGVRRVVGWIFRALKAVLKFLVLFLLIAWAALAIYFSNMPWPWARLALAIAFAFFAIWALWLSNPKRTIAFAIAFLAVVAGWIAIPASHDRPWRPEVAVMPRAIINGDNVRITGVRDFTYRSRNDFDVRYVERDIQLSHVTGIDFYVSYWSEGLVGHTFLSFIFDNAPPLSISIETRPEVGEGFDPLASMFKQFELIYVVGTERDLVGVRASHRREAIFLYHLNSSAEDARRLLQVYLERINELADRPEWYHLLTNSCTINIIRYANAAGREGRLDFRHVLNGLIDSYLYRSGRVNTELPFQELRERSRINAAVEAAEGKPDFSDRIRVGLPPARP
ncbi:MAG TPA: DUF4105 domain-containing protein [Xanthobacteraceae bacterium]|nr:DUF4105 domain-containing protein [Xanthobacteraceae bacterium]